MCANLILRASCYPDNIVFEPKCCQVDGIERYFGTLKGIKNNPASTSVATAIPAAQLLHRRQCKKPLKDWSGLLLFSCLFCYLSYSIDICCSTF